MELRAEDFYLPCSSCKGGGQTLVAGDLGAPLLGISSIAEAHDCRVCGGTGMELTQTGKTVRDFIRLLLANGMLSDRAGK
jgi:hypothetical protein